MKIWVDADACPSAVKEIICRAALKRAIETVFVANKDITLSASPHLSAVRVPLGPDVVDQYIVSLAQAGDLAISQDIPLAAQLIALGVTVISPYGTLFTDANIGDRLSTRDFLTEMRDSGLITGGPKPFGEKEKRQFANMFDQALHRLLNA